LGDSKNYISGYIFKLPCFGENYCGELPEIKNLEFPGCAKFGVIPQIIGSWILSHRKSYAS
jgi:hypothetical protein